MPYEEIVEKLILIFLKGGKERHIDCIFFCLGNAQFQHQRPHEEKQIKWSSIDDWYKKGTTNERATKFRKV